MKTVTAAYSTADAARNAMDELLADGIDREKIFLDTAKAEVKVMIPDTIEREIAEILNRHQPTTMH
ncbi:hypothetical protein G3580_16640 [Nitrogeniibacter mangrovi]|uniref:Uncharacterized protein n=1 Tax=Nitrogeniibacter mangrovi TaxID=2016596 RepID=A0A6C1B9R7_9RHOO|nr:hypothetical protein [Nitrogeniibacter mangrovi]QID19100.1 hypothetical protein G3580_16640 [Nitrogeniibacter mangrovi]